jgi:chaperonin GroEL (HSP60 family)
MLLRQFAPHSLKVSIPGGGITLFSIARNLEVETENKDQALGVEIVKEAIVSPIVKMSENSGLDAQYGFGKIKRRQKTQILE